MIGDIPKNLGCLFQSTADQFAQKEAFLFKQGASYQSISWGEAYERVGAVASSFMAGRLNAADRVAILSENRLEWALVDLAAQCIGASSVPIYPTLTASEVQYICQDSEAAYIAVSNKSQLEKIISIQKTLPHLKGVIGFDPALAIFQKDLRVPIHLLKDLEKTPLNPDFHNRLKSVEPDSIASIIYTSGTTGSPKGVMLTHSNFIYNVLGSKDTLNMNCHDIHLSFLPLSHVFERMAGHYLMIHIGATIAYAEDMESVPKNILEVRPTFILGVPRFYEKIKARVLEAVQKGSPIKKALFFWSKELGEKKRTGKLGFGILARSELMLAEALVYKKFRARLGGRLRFCISGGAPLARELAEFFSDLGVMIYEGYGLTETSPVISVNRAEKFKFGTVGIALQGVRVKIAEDGEIATAGPCVMKGYYHKPEETASVLKDGWFYTGDLGHLDKEGFLSITGRKKELIVTSGGKKVSPRSIEETLEKDPLIQRAVLFGDGERFITALIVPNADRLTSFAEEEKIAFSSYADLMKDEKIIQSMDIRVQAATAHLASFEKVKYFALLERDFSQEAGELTPTLKVKRDVVWSRYKDLLLPFYSNTTH